MTATFGPEAKAAVDAVIRARRTSMVVDRDRPVEHDIVEELCTLATWAPCHKRTWPWRFATVSGGARVRLGEVIAEAMESHGDEPEKVAKARTKYLRTPTVMIIGSVAGDSPTRTAENRDATAVAVQNFMLGATTRGLATYWGSCPRGANDPVAQFCGFPTDTTIVSLMYLGWAVSVPETPTRPAPQITVLDH
ncbi:MAG: nitroreductase family protein [Ilumatobacteraceae bacterium]